MKKRLIYCVIALVLAVFFYAYGRSNTPAAPGGAAPTPAVSSTAAPSPAAPSSSDTPAASAQIPVFAPDFSTGTHFWAPKGFTGPSMKNTLPPPPAPQDDWINLELNYATYLSAVDPSSILTMRLQQKLDQYMPGKVKINVHYSGSLLGQADIYDGILVGTADMGMIDLGVVASRFPLSQIFTFPSIELSSPMAASMAMQEWAEQTKPAEYNDVIWLQGQGNGAPCFYTKTPLATLADLKGRQIRATTVLGRTISALGGVPVSMESGEIYEAMRSGLIDGQYSNFGSSAFFNLEEVGGHALITPLGNISYCHVMNKDVFNSMPPSQQEAFMYANKEAFLANLLWQENTYLSERTVTCASKTQLAYLEGPALEEFKAACASLLDDYIKDLDARGLDGSGHRKIIEEIAAKYNADFSWEDYKSYYPPYNNLELYN